MPADSIASDLFAPQNRTWAHCLLPNRYERAGYSLFIYYKLNYATLLVNNKQTISTAKRHSIYFPFPKDFCIKTCRLLTFVYQFIDKTLFSNVRIARNGIGQLQSEQFH